MLYYGDSGRQIDPAASCWDLQEMLETIGRGLRQRQLPPSARLRLHSDLVGAAISLGQVHQAVSDHLNTEVDELQPQLDALSAATIQLGRCVYRSSLALGLCDRGLRTSAGARSTRHGGTSLPKGFSDGELLQRAQAILRGAAPALPAGPLLGRVPEGYAHYALYPETYFASLHRAVRDDGLHASYVVVGIRSIGCSLAGFVAGALAEMGAQASVETVRPRGYPFERYVELGRGLRRRLEAAASAGSRFVVVDEGPGLSHSSFLSVCSSLNAVGIHDEELLLLSAWSGAAGAYTPESSWDRWQRLRVYHTSAANAFNGWRALLAVGTTANCNVLAGAGARASLLDDLSGGEWRKRVYPSRDHWPPVNRSGERVKLLLRLSDSGDPTGQRLALAKFAGLGRYGAERFRRACAIASAGFSPAVIGHAYGFIWFEFEPGAALRTGGLSTELMSRMVDYYAYLAATFTLSPAPRFAQLAELILVNARKGLDLDASNFVAQWRSSERAIDSRPLTLVDGRPQPHEWIEVKGDGPSRFLKTDSADHFDDHTLVGEQSILWDIAGACVEWDMPPESRQEMLRRWSEATGDVEVEGVIDLYRAAYLAFRLGAVHYAAESAADEAERRALQAQHDHYAGGLRSVISRTQN